MADCLHLFVSTRSRLPLSHFEFGRVLKLKAPLLFETPTSYLVAIKRPNFKGLHFTLSDEDKDLTQ